MNRSFFWSGFAESHKFLKIRSFLKTTCPKAESQTSRWPKYNIRTPKLKIVRVSIYGMDFSRKTRAKVAANFHLRWNHLVNSDCNRTGQHFQLSDVTLHSPHRRLGLCLQESRFKRNDLAFKNVYNSAKPDNRIRSTSGSFSK